MHNNMSSRNLRSSIRKRKEEGSLSKRRSTDLEFYQVSSESDNHSENEPIVPDAFSLQYIQSSMYATIIEDTIMELGILAECNSSLRICKTRTDMEMLRAKKFKVAQPTVKDELDVLDRSKLSCDAYKLDKLDNDRKFLNDVLMATYMDLSLHKSWKALDDKNKLILDLYKTRTDLAEDEFKNRLTRRELAKQLRQQRNHMKSANYDTDVIIDGLKTQVEDANSNAECRNRYVGNWQRARTEQHAQGIADSEAIPTEVIEYYKERIDHEQRVHNEIEMIINIAINEILHKVESWMNKYDKDIEAVDLRIQIKKNEHQNAYEQRLELENTLETHDKLMKDWQDFKDEREKARMYREKMHKSAVIVQAWWRGLLVRLQLGPYKVVKRPGKQAGKGTGKKK